MFKESKIVSVYRYFADIEWFFAISVVFPNSSQGFLAFLLKRAKNLGYKVDLFKVSKIVLQHQNVALSLF